jgi:hypothetical protein
MEGGGEAAAGPNMAVINSMLQSVGNDPSQRMLAIMPGAPGLMPSLDRQGWGGSNIYGGGALTPSAQGGIAQFKWGMMGGNWRFAEDLKACFVGKDQLFQMESMPISGAEIRGEEIRGEEIVAASRGSSILSEASSIEAPKNSAAEIRAATTISAPSMS